MSACLTQISKGKYPHKKSKPLLLKFNVFLACLVLLSLLSDSFETHSVLVPLVRGKCEAICFPLTSFKKDSWITLTDSSQTLRSVVSGPHRAQGKLWINSNAISDGNWTLNLSAEYPLMNCIRAFFRCSSQVFFFLADMSTATAKRKCKVCWYVHLFWSIRNRTQGDERPQMELSSKYRVGSPLKRYYTLGEHFHFTVRSAWSDTEK